MMEFDKEHTDWLHGDDAPTKADMKASTAGKALLAIEAPQPPAAPTERLQDLWKELINRAYTSDDPRLSIQAAGLEADWNPALHPRGPDGKFVERPYDVPDGIRGLDTEDIVSELADADPEFSEKVADLKIDGVLEVDDSLDDVIEEDSDDLLSTPEGLKPTSDVRIQRGVDDYEQHAANIRDEVGDSLAVPPVEVNGQTYPDGVDFDDGTTLPPRAAAWELAFEPGIQPDDDVESLRNQGYFVREKAVSESGLFEYIVGITPQTDDPDVEEPESDDGIPATADMPDYVAELAQDKIDQQQETYDRFGGDGDFHLEDPSSINWEDIEDPHELARNLIDITPLTGMANESDADKHKGRIKNNLDQMQNAQAAVQAATRLQGIEQDRSGGSVGWARSRDGNPGANNTMNLKVSSPESTVNHEMMHSVVDGNPVEHDVNTRRATRYNQGDRDVSWADTLLDEQRDNRELWQYMLTYPEGEKPPGWDDFAAEVEADFQDLADKVDEELFTGSDFTSSMDNPGPNDSWGETLDRGDVIEITYLDDTERLLIDEVNEEQFDDGTHQVIATRLPGEAEQKLKMDDDGNFIFGDKRNHIQRIAQGAIDDEDRDPPEVTDPVEALSRDAPEDPEERLEEFTRLANKAWYRQAWATTEHRGAESYNIGSNYSITNGHETVAKLHEEMTTLDDPDVSASKVRKYAQKHPDFFRSYVQNFGIDDTARANIERVITSDRQYGDGELADGLEALLEGVQE